MTDCSRAPDRVVILGAGRGVTGSLPPAMVNVDPEHRLLDWLLAAFAVLPEPEICFVGGYEVEAIYHEGFEIAEALAARGTAAAVLKYRLPSPETATHPELVPLADIRRALKTLRARSQELGIGASHFGLLGFSAGSHLATTAGVRRSEDENENPDFSLLIYGVTRMTQENRDWLESKLYHRPMTTEELASETLLDHVDADTPPAFLVHALDDDTCHYTETTDYANALIGQGVDAEIHLFARGGHGFGAGRDEDGTSQWIDLAVHWLDRLDLAE